MAAQRALIVENEPLIAIDLEAILRALGFDVCGLASNPREAVELATSRRPDLVLMDVYLDEGLQGIKAAKWLRDACDIPVLFVTVLAVRLFVPVTRAEQPHQAA